MQIETLAQEKGEKLKIFLSSQPPQIETLAQGKGGKLKRFFLRRRRK
jgi:hypothetical protein